MQELNKAFLMAMKNSEKKARTCMFHKCNNIAIKSHVLQKNGILREISTNNHLIEQCPPNPFELKNKGILDFKLIGINDVYTFMGFCKFHDSEIFKPIEVNTNLNFNRKIQQTLFSYRGLCQEIRRKEIASEWIKEIYDLSPIGLKHQYDVMLVGYKIGIWSLKYFKNEFEKAIITHDYCNFHFETITIPNIEMCISVPLTIGELDIPADNSFETWKKKQNRPLTTSFINIFPKGEESIVIVGYHKGFICKWTMDLLLRLKNGTRNEVFKELSDLITMRLEFWAMSESLFKKISSDDISLLKDFFRNNVYNHSPNIKTEINLFKYL
ncbi:MAG: hypothetical protein CVU05_03920 [Bacteroidetes bacterium HGW-Bacteroidetes-21]|jgi:hypothetical protein|nr:MAG: hypothetical protein CVU05_03920 [Bacteroidetes bacterium HGW-Bacteroidetes-21]